jgi:hypothetical protein
MLDAGEIIPSLLSHVLKLEAGDSNSSLLGYILMLDMR